MNIYYKIILYMERAIFIIFLKNDGDLNFYG